jgi:hypothetical protein
MLLKSGVFVLRCSGMQRGDRSPMNRQSGILGGITPESRRKLIEEVLHAIG